MFVFCRCHGLGCTEGGRVHASKWNSSCVLNSPRQRSPGPGPRKGVGMPTVGSCHVSSGKQRIISCRSASPPRCAGGHGRGKLTESDRRLKDGKKPTEGSYRVSTGEHRIINSRSPPCTAACSASGGKHNKAADPPSAKRARKSFQLDARRVPEAPAPHDARRAPRRIGFALLPSKHNLFPRALMEDAIAGLHEDDDIRDVVASSPVRPRAARWKESSLTWKQCRQFVSDCSHSKDAQRD